MPISPAIAGGVYSVLGIHSVLSEFVLASWSIGLAIGTYLLFFQAFAHLRSSIQARLCALGFACLVPTYLGQETIDFRYWEGGLATFLCALFLERLLVFQQQNHISMRVIIGMCLLAAFLFFVNPLVGVGAYACAAVFCWKQLDTPRIIATIPLAACTLGIFVIPWALRNEIVLGHPVLLRDNFGLELATANYPGAFDNIDPGERFRRREEQIQPRASDQAYNAMLAAGGEVSYSSRLQEMTVRWIRANPSKVLRLAVLHLRQTFVPQTWQFSGLLGSSVRIVSASLAGALGVTAIGYALMTRRPNWVYPALLVAIPALCYSLFQPVPRYTYLFYPVLVFAAADLLFKLIDNPTCRSAAIRNQQDA
jgi:hypothetical protein